MTSIKIGYSNSVSAVPQTGVAARVAQEVSRQQMRVLHGRPAMPYGINREESITCRETTAGTYEAVLSGIEPAIYGPASSRKGQIVDLWI
jgi:hypothetical protein